MTVSDNIESNRDAIKISQQFSDSTLRNLIIMVSICGSGETRGEPPLVVQKKYIYGRGGAPGLPTYLRIGSNLEI